MPRGYELDDLGFYAIADEDTGEKIVVFDIAVREHERIYVKAIKPQIETDYKEDYDIFLANKNGTTYQISTSSGMITAIEAHIDGHCLNILHDNQHKNIALALFQRLMDMDIIQTELSPTNLLIEVLQEQILLSKATNMVAALEQVVHNQNIGGHTGRF